MNMQDAINLAQAMAKNYRYVVYQGLSQNEDEMDEKTSAFGERLAGTASGDDDEDKGGSNYDE